MYAAGCILVEMATGRSYGARMNYRLLKQRRYSRRAVCEWEDDIINFQGCVRSWLS